MLNNFTSSKDKSLMIVVTVFFIIIVTMLAWAATFQINDFVRGQGKIIPSGKSRVVQHMEGGIVTYILKREGSIVESGDVIMAIDNTEAQTSVEELRIESEAYDIQIMRLQAELSGNDIFEPDVNVRQENSDVVATQTELFNSRRRTLSEQMSGLQQQISQKEYQITELTGRIQNLREELEVAQDKHAIITKLNASGAASNSRVLESESVMRSFKTRIDEARGQIPVMKSEISELQNRMTEIRQNYNADVYEELSDLQIKKQKISERLKNNAQRLSRTEIFSPVDGVIKNLRFNTIGGVIKPGDAVAEITPLDETLIVEARISNTDRDSIWMEQPARVKINAFDSRALNTFKGRVTDISPDSLIDENGGSYYRVIITLDNADITDAQADLYPGMSTEVNIVSGKRSILSYLFRPLRNIGEGAFGL